LELIETHQLLVYSADVIVLDENINSVRKYITFGG